MQGNGRYLRAWLSLSMPVEAAWPLTGGLLSLGGCSFSPYLLLL